MSTIFIAVSYKNKLCSWNYKGRLLPNYKRRNIYFEKIIYCAILCNMAAQLGAS